MRTTIEPSRNPRPVFKSLLVAERHRPQIAVGRCSRHMLTEQAVIIVVDEHIVTSLVFENAIFTVCIAVHVATIAIQMVRRNVEQNTDNRSEGVNVVKLEAGHFQDNDCLWGYFLPDGIRKGVANVASNNCFAAGIAKNVTQKGSWWSFCHSCP